MSFFRYISFLLLVMLIQVLSVQSVFAQDNDLSSGNQDFFYLAWDRMPLDSVCPLYTEVIPINPGNESESYDVRILYPEWAAMSVTESALMSQWDERIGEDLNVVTYVGRSRGRVLLDVSFIPVVKREGKYFKLISAKMEIKPTISTSMSSRGELASGNKNCPNRVPLAERYTRESRLAHGRWVKIGIYSDGMYQLTREQLLKMGFSNPDNVHLYGHGGHLLSELSNPAEEYDDIEEVPLYKADANRWLFWGNGLTYWDGDKRVFNPYANIACYFLTEENSSSQIVESQLLDKCSNIVSSFFDHVLFERDEYAYFEGGRNLFDPDDFASNNKRIYTLKTPVPSLSDERLTVVFTSSTANSVQVSVNGKSFDSFTLSKPATYTYGVSSTKNYDVNRYKNGTTWNVQLSAKEGVPAHLDYISLRYRRAISVEQSYVAFQSGQPSKVTYQISGMTDAHKVMMIGEPGSPACLLPTQKNGTLREVTVEDGMRRLVCFNPKLSYPEPLQIGGVSNQNLHALDSLDMVIIIPANGVLRGQAERLAEAHRAYDGLRVKVIRADQIYNEFSSGTYDATAYRRLMKMLYDRAGSDENVMPRYLLLFGDCLWDNRLLTTAGAGRRKEDYLLCFESENSFSDPRSYMMEDYFGLLDDGEGGTLTNEKVDLGIGRFPVVTVQQAKSMVDKHIDYISNANAGEWKNRILMIADDGDNNSHMEYSDDVADIIVNRYPQVEVKKVMLDAYQRVSSVTTNSYPEVTALIRQQIDDGVLMANYMGHGSQTILSVEKIWGTSQFETVTGRTLPLWVTAACITMPMDGIVRNQGEVAVLRPNGGALAFLGTARTVYSSNNWQMNRNFCRFLFDVDMNGRRNRLGDALRLAKSTLASTEGSNRENKIQYILAGDPALVMGAPNRHVVIDSLINKISGEVTDRLSAGMPIRMVGHIEDAEGDLQSNFNGLLYTRAYDSMDTITCLNNAGAASEPFVFTERRSLLFAGKDSVIFGRFDTSFIVPKDIKYSGGFGRIVCYAINDSLTVEANGYREDFTVDGAVDISDMEGPQIDLMVNGQYGGIVNATPFVTAQISDESGINYSGIGVGHDVLLSVDDRPEWTFVLNDYFQSDFGDFTQGALAYTLPLLPEGLHTVKLRAWDMMNNTSVSQLAFNVNHGYKPTLSYLTNSPNPASTGTTFFLQTDLPGSVIDYTIEVFNFAGQRVWMRQGSGSSSTGLITVYWNLSVGNGYGKIGNGIYLYRATITSGNSKRVTESKKLVINW